jgi:hypothetical protein
VNQANHALVQSIDHDLPQDRPRRIRVYDALSLQPQHGEMMTLHLITAMGSKETLRAMSDPMRARMLTIHVGGLPISHLIDDIDVFKMPDLLPHRVDLARDAIETVKRNTHHGALLQKRKRKGR